ncbi:MAG: 16S rRNA (guanine(527)-N(7))-methyltransferase RsmG [Lachnospiraceae bacterium]|nr:16S rRNA (guanine(527)-N(7))-methyltransferase RsmG [Lachnospiraceae bacterium]
MYQTDKFVSYLKEWNIELNETQVKQFIQYYELLIEKNKVMNLTGITEWEEVVKKHFVDSLALVKAVDLNGYYKILDLGTGAGFPGVPLKIAFPNLEIVLLDSLNKRIKFLQEVIDTLQLNGIEAYHGRAEEFAKKEEFRENFDYVVSRAVANLATLSEYCIPYVKINGKFIPYKSGEIMEELVQSKKAIHILGGSLLEVKEFLLPDSDIGRSLVIIDKVQSTKKKYPRMGGKPSKEPLGREIK